MIQALYTLQSFKFSNSVNSLLLFHSAQYSTTTIPFDILFLKLLSFKNSTPNTGGLNAYIANPIDNNIVNSVFFLNHI